MTALEGLLRFHIVHQLHGSDSTGIKLSSGNFAVFMIFLILSFNDIISEKITKSDFLQKLSFFYLKAHLTDSFSL